MENNAFVRFVQLWRIYCLPSTFAFRFFPFGLLNDSPEPLKLERNTILWQFYEILWLLHITHAIFFLFLWGILKNDCKCETKVSMIANVRRLQSASSLQNRSLILTFFFVEICGKFRKIPTWVFYDYCSHVLNLRIYFHKLEYFQYQLVFIIM